MLYTLHDYQRFSVDFIKKNPISALFLDCGLGKTVIALTALNDLLFENFDVRRVLIVAPLRVARDTWAAEIAKWNHLQRLICSVAVGTESERHAALSRPADIYVINRENVQWLIEESDLPFDFDTLVIDELSSFKNSQTKRFKSLLRVRPKLKRIIGLTGTPATNGMMDLFAEFRLLDMGARLGRFIGQYRTNYFIPDKRNGQVVFSYKLLPGAEELIYNKINDITISMCSTDHIKMPELISSEYQVVLAEEEKRRYDEMKREMVLQFNCREITAANAAALSGKLSQMANGAVYDDNGGINHIHDRKLDALEDIIEAANGKPLLIAYWFKHDLERISARLKIRHIPFSRLDTTDSLRKWNNGELLVALIHPASAGHGLNLQSGGNHLVWFGLTWSLELYQQTNARLWRQGQRAKTVIIQHIIARDTIDERIMRALSLKDAAQSALIEAVKADLRRELT
ncbi:MAG: DEAD/DEAH box helicase [Clostridia bacterium]